MKNLFGTDITDGAENGKPVGESFIVRRTDAGQDAEIEAYCEQFAEAERKSSLPAPLGLLKAVCLFGWAIPLCGMISAGSFAEGYRRVPWLFWICGICFIIWIALWIYEKKLQKQTADAPETKALNERAEALLRNVREQLGVPDSAMDLDVLGERFVMKNGVPKHKSFDGFNEYLNLDLYAFVQDGSLFLASTDAVWEIPCSALRGVHRTKRMSFAGWHKAEPHTARSYKKYKITVNQFGTYFAHCVQIEIADARGDFYLLIPEYDAEAFIELTGLHPDTEK